MQFCRFCGVLSARLLLSALIVFTLFASIPARAEWPDHPVRLIVPYGAGNVTDVVARVLAEDLGQRWGQRIVVDNLPGAGGAIGTAQGARAKPDGYTITFLAMSALSITPRLTKGGVQYDPLQDFTPIGMIAV